MTRRVTLRSILVRARELVRRRRIEQELDEELQFHLDCETAQRVARGASPEDARRDAQLAFGGVQRFREETRGARGFAALDGIARDVRFAIRRLLRAPAYTLGTMTTLGVGLGVAAGIAALVYGVMLRPLPYPNPSRLVHLSILTPGLEIPSSDNSSGTFLFLAERARSYSAVGMYMENAAVSITEGDAPERVVAALMTPNVLGILGAVPAAGRLLSDEDAAQGFTSPVMISYDLWQRRYGGDPSIVGRYIELNRGKRLVVGVLPRAFDFPSREAAVYYPETVEATRADLTDRSLSVIGRLANGVSVSQAQQELDVLLPRLGERFPEVQGEALRRARIAGRVETMRDAMIAPVRGELRLLGALMIVVLLIVIANAATLTLLRAERVHGEIAVIRALGASAADVMQRFLAETIVVALAGGVVALPVAAIAIITKLGVTDAQMPRLHEVGVTPLLVAVVLVIATLIGLALGPLAAARASRGGRESLRVDTRGAAARSWRRAQETLVAVQIALAMALLLSAGLFTASMLRLRRVDLGFVAKDGAQFALQIPFRGYETYQRTVAFDLGVVDALRRAPGVTEAAAAMEMPSTPQLLSIHPTIESTRADGRAASAVVRINVVSSNFFHTMQIPLRAGRTFESGDLAAAAPGVILSATLAHDLFGDENPVGRIVRFTTGKYPPYHVVGVSGDVFDDRVRNGPLRSIYYPLLDDLAPSSTETEQRIPVMPGGMHFLVRSTLPVEALVPEFRAAVRSVDPRVPVWGVSTLDDVVAATMVTLRLSMLLLAAAAIATLVLGAIGIYSIVAYAVAGRTPELAVRLALGASPSGVSRLVYRESVTMVGSGVVIGVLLSLGGSRIIRGLLYDVSPTDPRIFIAGIIAVMCIAAAALYAPARRAANTDPASVLRG